MTMNVDRFIALMQIGLTPQQINQLAFYRWRLCRYGHAGNPLMTPDALRQRRCP